MTQGTAQRRRWRFHGSQAFLAVLAFGCLGKTADLLSSVAEVPGIAWKTLAFAAFLLLAGLLFGGIAIGRYGVAWRCRRATRTPKADPCAMGDPIPANPLPVWFFALGQVLFGLALLLSPGPLVQRLCGAVMLGSGITFLCLLLRVRTVSFCFEPDGLVHRMPRARVCFQTRARPRWERQASLTHHVDACRPSQGPMSAAFAAGAGCSAASAAARGSLKTHPRDRVPWTAIRRVDACGAWMRLDVDLEAVLATFQSLDGRTDWAARYRALWTRRTRQKGYALHWDTFLLFHRDPLVLADRVRRCAVRAAAEAHP